MSETPKNADVICEQPLMSSFLENYFKSPNYPKAYPGDYEEVKNNLNAHFYVIYRNLNMCSSLCL